MTRALYDRLFSTKTLVRIACTALSLNSMGTAWAQGVPAGTQAPRYGTTWAAMRAQSHDTNLQTLALDSSKTVRGETSKPTESSVHRSTHHSGG